MIVLDTSVLSELTRQTPDTNVLSWLDALPTDEVATTAITAAELLHGVTRLSDGRRKTLLTEAVRALINEDFQGRAVSGE
ncbi:PIN domain-containing protein [Halopolyspora algeriensis]|uniref:PIN domain-containing protein n=1 Tax=Halopolyspora algeriensis TaxID=1500506 RepID=A0A368VQA4_9ACTN|nr:PIN domain-containing protein [Halopolyspora algeriensis]RCW43684.1 PIN domain-containing protein [Halopolyspora algeriensis]